MGPPGHRGLSVCAMTQPAFNEMVNTLPYADSPFQPQNFLIDSRSDISLSWNQVMFSGIKPCYLKQCTPRSTAHRPVGSTPLSVHAIGVITHSHPAPKACWTLYVHTQETVSHTLFGIAVRNKTVVIRLSVACETFR